ncbi:Teneurin-2 [Hondaea fermentalgiana]|uniref:Teneurin-2 n=1 Tax=Hondaea fermentalgiana TaxID=2315210 RepID=A0A2R5GP26_9STRA|nr:Teneurin-2 [Hondaea fermentalgiana]|eukprot:GBG32375.1 Teneurin-2 [Hondaea fermentalgiana]
MAVCKHHLCVLSSRDNAELSCTGYTFSIVGAAASSEFMNPLSPLPRDVMYHLETRDMSSIDEPFEQFNVLVHSYEQGVSTTFPAPLLDVRCEAPAATCVETANGTACFGTAGHTFHGIPASLAMGSVPSAVTAAVLRAASNACLRESHAALVSFAVLALSLAVSFAVVFRAAHAIVHNTPFLLGALAGGACGMLVGAQCRVRDSKENPDMTRHIFAATVLAALCLARAAPSGDIASATQGAVLESGAARQSFALATTDAVDSGFAGTRLTLNHEITVEDYASISSSVLGNNTELELASAFSQVRCGSGAAFCASTIVNVPPDQGLVVVSTEFKGSRAALLQVATDGTHVSDVSFEAALRDELSGTVDEFYAMDQSGSVSITTTFTDAGTEDPLTEAALEEYEAGAQLLRTAAANALAEHGSEAAELLSPAQDRCLGRTCGGHGVCDEATGACTCSSEGPAFWWGIECATQCECQNGGSCVSAMCQCEFPHFGLRCDQEKTCGCA